MNITQKYIKKTRMQLFSFVKFSEFSSRVFLTLTYNSFPKQHHRHNLPYPVPHRSKFRTNGCSGQLIHVTHFCREYYLQNLALLSLRKWGLFGSLDYLVQFCLWRLHSLTAIYNLKKLIMTVKFYDTNMRNWADRCSKFFFQAVCCAFIFHESFWACTLCFLW